MARQPTLKIAGNEIKDVVEVSYAVRNNADADGKPDRQRWCDGIVIRRIADGTKDVANWAKDASKSNRKKGEVQFYHPDGKEMKKLEWEEGYVSHYSIEYDHQQNHVEEVFVIQPKKIKVAGKEINYKWEEHD